MLTQYDLMIRVSQPPDEFRQIVTRRTPHLCSIKKKNDRRMDRRKQTKKGKSTGDDLILLFTIKEPIIKLPRIRDYPRLRFSSVGFDFLHARTTAVARPSHENGEYFIVVASNSKGRSEQGTGKCLSQGAGDHNVDLIPLSWSVTARLVASLV